MPAAATRQREMTNLQLLNSLLYVLEHGCKWRGLPKQFGNWYTIYTRMNLFFGADTEFSRNLCWMLIFPVAGYRSRAVRLGGSCVEQASRFNPSLARETPRAKRVSSINARPR
jgi:transposase